MKQNYKAADDGSSISEFEQQSGLGDEI